MVTIAYTTRGLAKLVMIVALLFVALGSGPSRAEQAGTLNTQQIEQLAVLHALHAKAVSAHAQHGSKAIVEVHSRSPRP